MVQEAQERQRDPELRIAPHFNLRSGRSLLLPSLTTCCDRQLIGVPRWIEWDWRLKPFTPSSRFQNALTAEAGMWWHSVSLSASRGWIQSGRSLLVNFFFVLIGNFRSQDHPACTIAPKARPDRRPDRRQSTPDAWSNHRPSGPPAS